MVSSQGPLTSNAPFASVFGESGSPFTICSRRLKTDKDIRPPDPTFRKSIIKSYTNMRSSWYRWFSTQLPIRMQITLVWIRAGGAQVKCKNCLTMAGTGKRSPAVRCSRLKNTPLCSPPSVESSALSINRRSMLSGTSQYTFSSSIVRDPMTLLAKGFVRGYPPGRPLLEVSSRPLTILQAGQKERKR